MSLQTTYPDTQPAAVAGAPATMVNGPVISRTVEDAAVSFGAAVAQGDLDKTCHAFTTGDTAILGIALLDRGASGLTVADGQVTGATENAFGVGESARIAATGSGRDVWVTASVAVDAGDPVYVIPATGAFAKTSASSAVQIPGARWDTSTSTTNQLAVVRLA